MNEDDIYSDEERQAELLGGTCEPDCMDAARDYREQNPDYVREAMRKAFNESAKLGDLLAGNPTEPSE